MTRAGQARVFCVGCIPLASLVLCGRLMMLSVTTRISRSHCCVDYMADYWPTILSYTGSRHGRFFCAITPTRANKDKADLMFVADVYLHLP